MLPRVPLTTPKVMITVLGNDEEEVRPNRVVLGHDKRQMPDPPYKSETRDEVSALQRVWSMVAPGLASRTLSEEGSNASLTARRRGVMEDAPALGVGVQETRGFESLRRYSEGWQSWECTGLLNRRRTKRPAGSNPAPSASLSGELAESGEALVSKTTESSGTRGFESSTLRECATDADG
jgi:hypothetical protein